MLYKASEAVKNVLFTELLTLEKMKAASKFFFVGPSREILKSEEELKNCRLFLYEGIRHVDPSIYKLRLSMQYGFTEFSHDTESNFWLYEEIFARPDAYFSSRRTRIF